MTGYFVGVEVTTDAGSKEYILTSSGGYSPIEELLSPAVYHGYGEARDASHRLAAQFDGQVRPFVRPLDRLKY